jgi:hypothetical protein
LCCWRATAGAFMARRSGEFCVYSEWIRE